ncbi:MAG: hypothetical protein WD830_05240 [Chloroflexota bacterium]
MNLRELTVSPRFWLSALAATLATLLVLGLPSGIVPNPVFVRTVATRPSDVAVWLVSAVLIGLTLATYVVRPHSTGHGDRGSAQLGVGGVVAFLAIACPVCNKIVLLAIGTSGALNVFAPLQPAIGLVSVALLAVTFGWRLRRIARGCPRCVEAPAG